MRYLIGKDIHEAELAAFCQDGWKQLSKRQYLDDDGEPVTIIGDAQQLRGSPRGTIVYLTSAYSDRNLRR